jgi:hypothetical protein
MYHTLSHIDRAVYEALRLALVAKGYTPDVRLANTKPLYALALEAIRLSGKQPIQLYGVGSWKAKQELKFNTIIIERGGISPSPIGYAGQYYFESNGLGGYNRKQLPIGTFTLAYDITLVAKDSLSERLMQETILNALGTVKELKGIESNGNETESKPFILFRNAEVDLSSEDYTERQVKYFTSEVFLEEDTLLDSNVPQLNETNLET